MKKYVLEIGDKEYTAEVKEMTAEYAKVEVDGNQYDIKLKEIGRKSGMIPVIQSVQPAAAPKPAAPSAQPAARPTVSTGDDAEAVKAPLPGLILEIKVNEGDAIKSGQDILVMEAMKMENQVQAPHDGKVGKIYVQKGDSVAEGDLLAMIERSFLSTM